MHHPIDRIAHTTAFVTAVVEHWLEREIPTSLLLGHTPISKTEINVVCFIIISKQTCNAETDSV